jgi:anti-sigma factor RsiW
MTDKLAVDPLEAAIDERFELLSAYLDGEVTTAERKQVETLLATDDEFQKQYRQLMRMHSGCSAIVVPVSQPIESLTDGVFAKIDRRRHKKIAWFGGGAIAASLVAGLGLGSLFGGNNGPQFQLAQGVAPITSTASAIEQNTPAPLMLALNDPIVSMPGDDNAIDVPISIPEIQIDSK